LRTACASRWMCWPQSAKRVWSEFMHPSLAHSWAFRVTRPDEAQKGGITPEERSRIILQRLARPDSLFPERDPWPASIPTPAMTEPNSPVQGMRSAPHLDFRRRVRNGDRDANLHAAAAFPTWRQPAMPAGRRGFSTWSGMTRAAYGRSAYR